MAVYRKRIGAVLVEIHDVDHGPPHCHVSGLAFNATAKVNLLTLEVIKPHGYRLPVGLKRFLKSEQAAMLLAWERVVSTDHDA